MGNFHNNVTGHDWPCTITRVSGSIIKVEMAGENGFQEAITSNGFGIVTEGTNFYNVRLPGLNSGRNYEVTFDRVN